MQTDKITKALLLIIALGLWMNLITNWLRGERVSAAVTQNAYTEGISRKDAFFENLTVRNLTITDSNAYLRILVHGGEDGTAQMSFYGEHSRLGGTIRVDKNGVMYSSIPYGRPRR